MSVLNFAMILLTMTGGTFHGTGRITGIAVDPSDPSGNTYRVVESGNDKNKAADARETSGNTVYISTAGGGVWK